MKNSIILLTIILRIYFFQIIKIVIAIIKRQTSYYPEPVRELEKRFSKLTGGKNSIMFSNGTSALEAALFSLDVNPSSIVGSTAFVIPASYCSAFNLGASVKFIDVSSSTLNINPNILSDDINSDIDVLIVTHFYGNPCDMKSIMHWARKKSVKVIEDCSHAHGAKIDGKPVGSWGDIGVFSLQGAKAIAAGEGGIAVTNDIKIASKMAAYGHQKSYKDFTFFKEKQPIELPPFGYGRKMRAHPLGAVLALVELNYLELKNKIYEDWVLKLEKLETNSSTFSIPKNRKGSKRGGYCQGVPLIFNSESTASKFLQFVSKKGINAFTRTYVDCLDYYQNENKIIPRMYITNCKDMFNRVVFIPFFQFIDFRRWNRLMNILKTLDKSGS